VSLRADPYEKGPTEAEMGYMRWYADNIWLFVPIQEKIHEFLGTMADYPFEEGVSLGPANINYLTLKAAAVMQRLKDLNSLPAPNN
jgi:hypothetical protein